MLVAKYIALALVAELLDLVSYILAPILVLFAEGRSGWLNNGQAKGFGYYLPRWLDWFQTPDNDLDGDYGWKVKNRPFLIENNGFKRWVNRTAWLWRNSMYGFAINVLGVKAEQGDVLETIGDPNVGNRPLVEGLVKRRLYRNGDVIAFQFYYVKAWSKTRCIRLNFGWKIWDYGRRDNYQLVFNPNPFMGYSK